MTAVEKIKAKILDLAIRGKLVPQDPNDEPASVLLERIKAEKAKLVKAKKIKKEKNPSEIIVGADGATYEKFADGTAKDISDELPFDLPQGWAWARIGDVVSMRAGKHISSEQIYDCSAKFPFPCYGGNGIRGYVSQYSHDGVHAIVGRQGALCGNLCIAEGKFYATEHAVVVKPYDKISASFSYWFLRALNLNKYATATAQPGLSVQEVEKAPFPLPPLAEQTRIVAKIKELVTYADKIGEASEGIEKTAERIDKKILDLAIHGQLVPQDPNDEPASELVRRIDAARTIKVGGKKSRAIASDRPAYEIDPPFDIPDSWEWVKFGTLIQVIAGVSYQKDDVTTSGVRILRGGNIKEDARIYLHDDDVFLPAAYAEDNTSVKAGDIVVVASTGSSTVIGRPAVATETMLGVQIGAFLRIVRAVDDSIMSWLPVIFLGNYYRNFIRSKSKGTNIKNLKTEYLTELPVPLPPLVEQKRIVKKIKELRAMTKSITM